MTMYSNYLRHSDWLNSAHIPEGMNLRMVNNPFRTTMLVNALGNEANGKVVIDMGAGTGLLGMSAIGHGASFVYFVEGDTQMAHILENILPKRLKEGTYKIIVRAIEELTLADFDGPIPELAVSEFYGPRLFDEGYVNYTKHVRTLFPDIQFIPETFNVDFYLADIDFRLPIWPDNKLLLEHYIFMYKEKGFTSKIKAIDFTSNTHLGTINFNANTQTFDNNVTFTVTEDKMKLIIGVAAAMHKGDRLVFTNLGWVVDRSDFGKTFKIHFDVDNYFNPRKIDITNAQ